MTLLRHFVVVPFSKAEWQARTLANLERTGARDVVIVENGSGVGLSWPMAFRLIKSEPHQSKAKNAGIECVRRLGGGLVSIFDCDDYYGPGYLEESAQTWRAGWIVGKADHFAYDARGLFYVDRGNTGKRSIPVIGGSQTFHSDDCPPFDESCKYGEDYSMCAAFQAMGGDVQATSGSFFCYMRDRKQGHSYPIDFRRHERRQGHRIVNCGSSFNEKTINGGMKPWER